MWVLSFLSDVWIVALVAYTSSHLLLGSPKSYWLSSSTLTVPLSIDSPSACNTWFSNVVNLTKFVALLAAKNPYSVTSANVLCLANVRPATELFVYEFFVIVIEVSAGW